MTKQLGGFLSIIAGMTVMLAGCQEQVRSTTLEAALADAIQRVIASEGLVAPELVVVDTTASPLNSEALAAELQLPIGSITRSCTPGQACFVDPPIAAFLSLDRIHDDATGAKVFTLTYHSNPPPYGSDTYSISHEYVMIQGESGWQAGEVIEEGEH